MRLVIFGVSNMLGEILDCALALGLTPSLVVMNMPQVVRTRTKSVEDCLKLFQDPPRIVQLEDFSPQEGECYFIGTNSPHRRQLVQDLRSRFGLTFCTLVHPLAFVSPRSSVASGVLFLAHSSIGPGSQLGEHVYIGRKVSIGHDTVVESYANLRAGCNVAGNVHVGYGATVGMGANIIEELEIGREASVAAGAVVIDDVPARVLVAGVPAKFKKNL